MAKFLFNDGRGSNNVNWISVRCNDSQFGRNRKETTHKHRAINTLTGFTAIVVICALALIGGQNYQILGIEWLIVSNIAACIYIDGITRARKKGRSRFGLGLPRLLLGQHFI